MFIIRKYYHIININEAYSFKLHFFFGICFLRTYKTSKNISNFAYLIFSITKCIIHIKQRRYSVHLLHEWMKELSFQAYCFAIVSMTWGLSRGIFIFFLFIMQKTASQSSEESYGACQARVLPDILKYNIFTL